MKTLIATLFLAALATSSARADSVSVVFDQATQTVAPGGTVQFFGTITNLTASTVYLNADSITLDGLSLTLNDLFLANAPFFLDPGASSGDIELFDVSASSPLLDPAGKYLGSDVIQGGADDNAQNLIGLGTFSVVTQAASAAPIPEPATLALVLSGIPAALAAHRRRTR